MSETIPNQGQVVFICSLPDFSFSRIDALPVTYVQRERYKEKDRERGRNIEWERQRQT